MSACSLQYLFNKWQLEVQALWPVDKMIVVIDDNHGPVRYDPVQIIERNLYRLVKVEVNVSERDLFRQVFPLVEGFFNPPLVNEIPVAGKGDGRKPGTSWLDREGS